MVVYLQALEGRRAYSLQSCLGEHCFAVPQRSGRRAEDLDVLELNPEASPAAKVVVRRVSFLRNFDLDHPLRVRRARECHVDLVD